MSFIFQNFPSSFLFFPRPSSFDSQELQPQHYLTESLTTDLLSSTHHTKLTSSNHQAGLSSHPQSLHLVFTLFSPCSHPHHHPHPQHLTRSPTHKDTAHLFSLPPTPPPHLLPEPYRATLPLPSSSSSQLPPASFTSVLRPLFIVVFESRL